MTRKQLFEFGDQSWLPKVFRTGLSDILRFFVGDIYSPVKTRIKEILRVMGMSEVVDLCSGSGGPWPLFMKDWPGFDLLLTDKYPEVSAIDHFDLAIRERVAFDTQSRDITTIQFDAGKLYTIFTGLHHLGPKEVSELFIRIQKAKSQVFVAEFTKREVRSIASMFLSVLVVLIITPMLRPFSLGRIFFIYLVPLIPLIYLWDGIASHCRSYTMTELEEIIELLPKADYQWRVEILKDEYHEVLVVNGTP